VISLVIAPVSAVGHMLKYIVRKMTLLAERGEVVALVVLAVSVEVVRGDNHLSEPVVL
jgi:hypothetical protein